LEDKFKSRIGKMPIEYVTSIKCDKINGCGSLSITEIGFNEIHGHRYQCETCGYTWWGGRLKNKENNKKRPPFPKPADLKVCECEICGLNEDELGYSEVLETHHKDHNPQNNERLNLWVLCTPCHKKVHHERTYRGDHFRGRFTNNEG
jgi:5-methylcytosine-specific restriction endonuclease McrA